VLTNQSLKLQALEELQKLADKLHTRCMAG
jgi:hypothetical protein